ncbi:MAG: hypothetical protein JSV03_14365, partial [Planctomycetota bacterium]
MDNSGVVMAEVAEKVQKIHTFTHKEKRVCTVVGKETPCLVADVFKYCSSEYGIVEEQYSESGELMHQIYILRNEKCIMIVFPMCKKYTRIPLSEQILQKMTQLTPKGVVEMLLSDEHIKLGRNTFDGVEAEGFEITNSSMLTDIGKDVQYLCSIEGSVMRLWVDIDTSLPVGLEGELITGRGLLTGFQRLEINVTAFDIQWDVELNDDIFKPNIPDDYTFINPNQQNSQN